MSQGLNKKMIAAGAIGNILEWYDFAVYGYFATTIGRVFSQKKILLLNYFLPLEFLRSAI